MQKSRRFERIGWLREHPALWLDIQVPFVYEQRDRRRELIELMRDAGLYAKTTVWTDIGLEGHLIEAREVLETVKGILDVKSR